MSIIKYSIPNSKIDLTWIFDPALKDVDGKFMPIYRRYGILKTITNSNHHYKNIRVIGRLNVDIRKIQRLTKRPFKNIALQVTFYIFTKHHGWFMRKADNYRGFKRTMLKLLDKSSREYPDIVSKYRPLLKYIHSIKKHDMHCKCYRHYKHHYDYNKEKEIIPPWMFTHITNLYDVCNTNGFQVYLVEYNDSWIQGYMKSRVRKQIFPLTPYLKEVVIKKWYEVYRCVIKKLFLLKTLRDIKLYSKKID